MSDFLVAIGLVFAIEGILFAALPGPVKRAMAHVTETPDTYKPRLAAKYRDQAPFVTYDPDRGDLFVIPGMKATAVPVGLIAAAGKKAEELATHKSRFEDLHHGGWDPDLRLADQDREIRGERHRVVQRRDFPVPRAEGEGQSRRVHLERCEDGPEALTGEGVHELHQQPTGALDGGQIGVHHVLLFGVVVFGALTQ